MCRRSPSGGRASPKAVSPPGARRSRCALLLSAGRPCCRRLWRCSRTLSGHGDGQGRFIRRRDAYGVERFFELGVDSFEVIVEWLRDVHRRRCLAKCGRVMEAAPSRRCWRRCCSRTCAPRPASGLPCDFRRGHKWAWRQAKDTTARHCALVTGCSYWHKRRKLPAAERPALRCLCGLQEPSRPHLMWCCSALQEYRTDIVMPENRLEERLLAKEVPEWPRPPPVLDYDGLR